MPDEIIDPDTFDEPSVAEASADFTEQSAKLEADWADFATGERTAAAEQELQTQETATDDAARNAISQLFEVNKAPIDIDAVDTMIDAIKGTPPSSITDPATLAALKAAEEQLPPETRDGIYSYCRAGRSQFNEPIMDIAANEVAELEAAAKDVTAEMDNPTSEANLRNLTDIQSEKVTSLENKLEPALKDKVEAKGLSWKSFFQILVAFIVLGAVGGVIGFISYWLKKTSDEETGCFMYYTDAYGNNDKIKLTGCDDYYAAHPTDCVCGTKIPPVVPTVAVTAQACNTTLTGECQFPYCLGTCSGPPCNNFPDNKPLQCTSGGDETQPGFVSYAYTKVTPWQVLGNGLNKAFQDLAQDLGQGLGGILGDLLKAIFGSVPSFVWVIIAVVIIAIAYFMLRK